MSGYVKQRKDLLEQDIKIPYWTDWDDMQAEQNTKHVTLDRWTRTYGQDDEGMAITVKGLFYSIDLDFADDQDCRYEQNGIDTDGTIWYMCQTHDELAPSDSAPCDGYQEQTYEEKLIEEGE